MPRPGRNQPALVRQGQISELINAKPKARRRILEEAAGISGLYQRRHEAELRLNATEQNLSRVDDVLEQLASQLATLARQARQAARYREIGEDLRRSEGMLLYRRWREADLARADAEALLRQRLLGAVQGEQAARAATKARQAAEDLLPLGARKRRLPGPSCSGLWCSAMPWPIRRPAPVRRSGAARPDHPAQPRYGPGDRPEPRS